MAFFGSDWGISLSPNDTSRMNWGADGELFFDMVEYFSPPEREEYLILRSELEEFIHEETQLVASSYKYDDEWIEFNEFIANSSADQFWICAWW